MYKTYHSFLLVVPTFAQRLADELKGISGGNDCSAVSQLVLFASAENDINQDGVPDSLKSDISVLRSYLQVSSFVIAPPSQQMQALTVNTAGSFFPSVDTELYASENVLVVAGRGYHCNTRSWGQSTYFFAYQLRNDTAPKGLGMSIVPGYLLNQFSMVRRKYLLVALLDCKNKSHISPSGIFPFSRTSTRATCV